MRVNLPVSQGEYEIGDGVTLLSATDLQSQIQPHNLVPHPDMPREAFADMWSTLQAGDPWTALVKNRRKNGDHYRVRANAAPVRRDGRLAGDVSVRTKPTRDVTQQNAALVEQGAASAEALKHQAARLAAAVAVFSAVPA